MPRSALEIGWNCASARRSVYFARKALREAEGAFSRAGLKTDPPYVQTRPTWDLRDLDAEDVAAVRALHALPSRVDARVATDETPLVPVESVRIARSRREVDRHQELARLAVVLVQAGSSFGVRRAVVAGHAPDVAFVVEAHVVQSRPLL